MPILLYIYWLYILCIYMYIEIWCRYTHFLHSFLIHILNAIGFNVKRIRFISQILISIQFIIFSISLVTTFLIHELFRNVCLQVSDSLWPHELQHIRLPPLNIRVFHIFWSSICWLTFNLGLLYKYIYIIYNIYIYI